MLIGWFIRPLVISLTTYPRKQLSEVEQTFSEARLTHDTALVLEEI